MDRHKLWSKDTLLALLLIVGAVVLCIVVNHYLRGVRIPNADPCDYACT